MTATSETQSPGNARNAFDQLSPGITINIHRSSAQVNAVKRQTVHKPIATLKARAIARNTLSIRIWI